MFSGTNPFYNQCIRKTVVAFGSLFNNIYIGTPAARIPLTYAPKQKWFRRLSESKIEDVNGQSFSMTLPRLGFAMTSWAYDPTRKRSTMTKKIRQVGGVDPTTKKHQYRFAEVPYDFTFELYIMPDTMDNGLRIIEQILPYFGPSYTVSINFTDIDKKIDIPFVLSSVNWADEYEGNMDSARSMMYTLTFVAKGYIIGPVRDSKFILETQVSTHNFDDLGKPRSETRDFARIWDRAVVEGTTGPSAPLSLTGSSYDVWEEVELFTDIDSYWNAGS